VVAVSREPLHRAGREQGARNRKQGTGNRKQGAVKVIADS